jgi:hypothetical protein
MSGTSYPPQPPSGCGPSMSGLACARLSALAAPRSLPPTPYSPSGSGSVSDPCDGVAERGGDHLEPALRAGLSVALLLVEVDHRGMLVVNLVKKDPPHPAFRTRRFARTFCFCRTHHSASATPQASMFLLSTNSIGTVSRSVSRAICAKSASFYDVSENALHI